MAEKCLCEELEPLFCKILTIPALQGQKGGMRNPTSRHLQTPKPLSTFQSDLSDAGHDESALRHALLSPLTFQIISAIMVARSAVAMVWTNTSRVWD